MKVLFKNETSHIAYVGWTMYHDYQKLETPNVVLLPPYAEILIQATDRYYLSVRVDDRYLVDAQISIATKVELIDEISPYLMFHYYFDVNNYEQCHRRIPYGYPIHTWRAHYVQGDMMMKLEFPQIENISID